MATILLADDNDDLRMILAQTLSDAGYAVAEAGNGRKAIELLAVGSFDAVVTDMLMPDADGAEVMNALRLRQPRPRLVVISGGGQIEPARYLQMAKALGADEVMRKPFLPSQLVAVLGRLLSAAPPA